MTERNPFAVDEFVYSNELSVSKEFLVGVLRAAQEGLEYLRGLGATRNQLLGALSVMAGPPKIPVALLSSDRLGSYLWMSFGDDYGIEPDVEVPQDLQLGHWTVGELHRFGELLTNDFRAAHSFVAVADCFWGIRHRGPEWALGTWCTQE